MRHTIGLAESTAALLEPKPPTWRQLVAAEPRLARLLREARAVDGSADDFCANSVWYGYDGPLSLRERVSRLVGWDRKPHPLLGTEDAYDVAYDTIYDALPDCRDCGCAREGDF
jgi:hypothetical protein